MLACWRCLGMKVLSDAQWAVLKPALDAARDRGQGGRPLTAERRTVEAIAWRVRNGARWRAVPADLGPLGRCSAAPALRGG